MNDYLPGTVIELGHDRDITDFLGTLFAAGGLVLSQVLQLTGLSTHTVQNWVKRKYINPPVGKKYDCNQFCKVVIMNMLGGTFGLESIKRMIDYAEVLSGDAALHIYTLFVSALSDVSYPADIDAAYDAVDRAINSVGFSGEIADRLRQIVMIMLMAQLSSVIKQNAQEMLDALDV